MISPTGSMKIRCDKWGDGHYGSRRKKANGNVYKHSGVDFECIPGQVIVAPITSIFDRIALPYADNSEYSGGLFKTKCLQYKIFYFEPSINIGQKVEAGEIIGYAQDIGLIYNDNKKGKMVPHIHIEIDKVDFWELINYERSIGKTNRNSKCKCHSKRTDKTTCGKC